MSTNGRGSRSGATQKILEALSYGEATTADLCEELGLDRRNVSSIMKRLTRPSKFIPKRVYVTGWRDTQFGERDYLRPVYALGSGEDVTRPRRLRKIQQAKAKRKYASKKRLTQTTNSVFNLGAMR